jgi:hypothetical protein
MALRLGTGLIEARGATKAAKLETALDKVLVELGWERTYEGKEPPSPDPADGATPFTIMANDDGMLAIQVGEEPVVRDLARLVSDRIDVPMLVLITTGALFGRRSVEVVCRKFEVVGGQVNELPVMATHTVDVTDVEHNELRQAENALRTRINHANSSLLEVEGTKGFKPKKVFRYKRAIKEAKFGSPRLARLWTQLETAESFSIGQENGQSVVKLLLAGGAKGMSFLKAEEIAELEKALQTRPELQRRRV